MRTVTRLLAPVALLAGLAAGCGDDGPEGAAPAAWTRSVCTELSQWLDGIEGRSTSLRGELGDVDTLQTARTTLVNFLGDAVELTDTLLDDFDDVGRPAVDDGEQLASDFRKGIAQARRIFADARTRAEEVPTDDPSRFQQAAEDLGTDIEEAGKRVESTFDGLSEKYDVPELDEAFDDDPACAKLNG